MGHWGCDHRWVYSSPRYLLNTLERQPPVLQLEVVSLFYSCLCVDLSISRNARASGTLIIRSCKFHEIGATLGAFTGVCQSAEHGEGRDWACIPPHPATQEGA